MGCCNHFNANTVNCFGKACGNILNCIKITVRLAEKVCNKLRRSSAFSSTVHLFLNACFVVNNNMFYIFIAEFMDRRAHHEINNCAYEIAMVSILE